MDSSADDESRQISKTIGWFILISAISPFTVAFFAALARMSTREVGGDLLVMMVSTGLMMAIAGVGIIMGKSFGYWCAYLATFFGGIGGLKNSFVPFVDRFVNLGPSTGNFFLLLNLILIAFLAWDHWTRISEEVEPGRTKVHHFGLILMLLAGLGSVGFGVAMEPVHKGSVSSTQQLPVVADYFVKLQTTQREGASVRYLMRHNKITHSINAIITGEAEEQEVRKFAEYHSFKTVDKPERYAKILPMARRWKLNEKGFPVDFAPPDLVFIGRPKSGDVAAIQIAWRKRDSKFTAEMMGSISEGTPPLPANQQ